MLSGKCKHNEYPVKDENGKLLTAADDQRLRWKVYFETTLNPNTTDIEEEVADGITATRSSAHTSTPRRSEIINAITKMKNYKAAGPDNMIADLLKCNITVSADALYPVIQMVWNKEELPCEWKQGMIVKLPKKGSLQNCDNWRGISLLNTTYKVIAQICSNSLQELTEHKLRDEQARFRPHRSCIDQSNTLRLIVEQSIEWRSSLYMVFVDFEKAFDTINRSSIWKALREKETPEKLIRVIQALYKDTKSAVLHRGKLSDTFNTTRGVRQGCPLSPLLFNIVLDEVMRKTMREVGDKGIRWTLSSNLADLDYADDICLLAHTRNDAQAILNALSNNAAAVGHNINVKKTKCMRINARNDMDLLIKNDQSIDNVDSFCYLGSTITTSGDN